MPEPHIDYHAVLHAADRFTEYCPVCSAVEEAERTYWDSVLFSQVGSEGFQDRFLAHDGFCPHHSRALAARRDGTAVAMLYGPLLRHRLRWLEEDERRPRLLRRLSRLRRRGEHPAIRSGRRATRSDCPLCARMSHWTDRYLVNLLRHQDDPALRQAVEAGPGLCLPHFRRLSELAGRGLVRRRIPSAAPWLRELHLTRYRAIDDAVAGAAHDAGGTAWERLIAVMEGGTGWYR